MADSKQLYVGQQASLEAAQLEKLGLENDKLKMELETLKNGKRLNTFTPYLPLVTVLITISGFSFGVYQYREQQQANRYAQAEQSTKDREARELQAKRDTEAAQREFMKPLLQNQLLLYLQASAAAATASTTTDPIERKRAINDFWRLYEGPLIIVESTEVSGAMVAFGECLKKPGSCDEVELRNRAHAIASKMQDSLLKSWNTNPENFAADKFKYH